MWDELREFFNDNSWVGWVSVAVLLGIAEMMSLDLVLLMLALGAAGGAVAAALDVGFGISLLVAIIVSVATLSLVRPNVVKRLHGGPELVSGHAALVGATAVVTDEVTETSGLVRLSGETWTARAFDPSDRIEPGTRVRVFEIKGATAIVHPD
jgi:membrane protein implicated in regulation of membrane protease activity